MTPAARRKGLEEALRRGGDTHTVEDVLDQLSMGEARLFENEDALIVVEIHDSPCKRVLHFWLATGELEAVVELSREVLAWAKEWGCKEATLAGRRGWEKVLASEGWAPMLTVMRREI